MKKLKPEYRHLLKRPAGKVISPKAAAAMARRSIASGKLACAVGDQTAIALIKAKVVPSLAIVDGFTRRKPIPKGTLARVKSCFKNRLLATNPAGGLSKGAMLAIAKACKAAGKVNSLLIVKGEEDLLFLPLVKCVPKGTLVLYGQPGEGVVAVVATPQLKARMGKIYSKAFA